MTIVTESLVGCRVAVIGAGTMGAGIAQVAATAGHEVVLIDVNQAALDRAASGLDRVLNRLVQKGRMAAEEADAVRDRIQYASEMASVADAGIVVEAIVEDIAVKTDLFASIEGIVSGNTILATNTSSLSVAEIAAACSVPARVIGAHFFNPAPVLPLVEIVPALQTTADVVDATTGLIDSWGKTTVVAKDLPGFIVNRVARPFYGEALRILDERIADHVTIDWAMKEIGEFRMGPFELMDLIGNDINYSVTRTVYEAFYHEPRYRPSTTQLRMVQAGRLGRKSGRGYYDYEDGATVGEPNKNSDLGEAIVKRVVAMLINEAADAVFWGVASPSDIDLAMEKGVNYPRGLLRWADDLGADEVVRRIEFLRSQYGEERYRVSPALRDCVQTGRRFHA